LDNSFEQMSSEQEQFFSEREQIVISLKRRRATLKEIADAIGVTTRERARQVVAKIVEKYGSEVLTSVGQFWTISEAAKEFNLIPNNLRISCIRWGIPLQQYGRKKRHTLSEESMRMLRQRFFIGGSPLVCRICGNDFFYGRGKGIGRKRIRQICFSEKCIKRENQEYHQNLMAANVSSESRFVTWHRILWERLQSHVIPATENWFTAREAADHFGLTWIQISYLGKRGFLITQPHPFLKWREKSQVTYAGSQVELAHQVYEEYQQQEEIRKKAGK
jgi:hypothetical protein